MEAWKLAVGAYFLFSHLVNLVSGAGPVSPESLSSYRVCYQARLGEGELYCPSDYTVFTMPEPGEPWMVRP